MAKFKPGDKVRSSVDGKTYIAMEESRPGFWWLADLDGRGNGLETREIDLTLANSRARNAKFKVGDKVTWRHHNGSYSNEVIDYIVPPNGYAFKDGGVGAESELRAGWVPESQTGRANMPPLNSRAANAKFKVGDVVSVKREAADGIGNPALARKRGRVIKVLPGGYYEVDGELGATGLELTDAELTLANSRACNGVRSTNAVVAKALNACGAARNAMDDAEAQLLWDDFQKKLAAVKRDADTLRSKFRADKHWAYAEQMGFVIQRLDDAVFK